MNRHRESGFHTRPTAWSSRQHNQGNQTRPHGPHTPDLFPIPSLRNNVCGLSYLVCPINFSWSFAFVAPMLNAIALYESPRQTEVYRTSQLDKLKFIRHLLGRSLITYLIGREQMLDLNYV